MMELEENELEREAANWAKSEKCREEGQEGRAEGPQGSVRTPEPGKGIGIVIKTRNRAGMGWLEDERGRTENWDGRKRW